MAAAGFTYTLGSGVRANPEVIDAFLLKFGWFHQQTIGGEITVLKVERMENGAMHAVTISFRGRTFNVGKSK